MVECYGVFCGHHNETMSFYKEQLQNNKKMQLLMRVSRPLRSHCRFWCFAGKRNRHSFPFTTNGADKSRRAWL